MNGRSNLVKAGDEPFLTESRKNRQQTGSVSLRLVGVVVNLLRSDGNELRNVGC